MKKRHKKKFFGVNLDARLSEKSERNRITIMFNCETKKRADQLRESMRVFGKQLNGSRDFTKIGVATQMENLVRLDIFESCDSGLYLEIDI